MKCPCGFDPFVQRITVGGIQVGISGLEEIFRSWLTDGKKSKDLSKEQILEALRKHNYIIPRLEEEYVEAIKALYTACCEKPPQR